MWFWFRRTWPLVVSLNHNRVPTRLTTLPGIQVCELGNFLTYTGWSRQKSFLWSWFPCGDLWSIGGTSFVISEGNSLPMSITTVVLPVDIWTLVCCLNKNCRRILWSSSFPPLDRASSNSCTMRSAWLFVAGCYGGLLIWMIPLLRLNVLISFETNAVSLSLTIFLWTPNVANMLRIFLVTDSEDMLLTLRTSSHFVYASTITSITWPRIRPAESKWIVSQATDGRSPWDF